MARMNTFYFNEIEKIPLLTIEEEKVLAEKACKGDKIAQKKLVESNLRFVVKIANQYSNFMDIEDLITEGNIGLMHAAEKYNPVHGSKFTTYAVWWIRAYIQKAIRETSTGIRFPSSKFSEMKLEKWQIASLDRTIDGTDDESVSFGALLKDDRFESPEEEYWNKESRSQLYEMLSTLNKNERAILIKRYGLDGKDPMSLSEIGKIMGYSKERIRQIEKQAIRSLKECYGNCEEYLDFAA